MMPDRYCPVTNDHCNTPLSCEFACHRREESQEDGPGFFRGLLNAGLVTAIIGGVVWGVVHFVG